MPGRPTLARTATLALAGVVAGCEAQVAGAGAAFPEPQPSPAAAAIAAATQAQTLPNGEPILRMPLAAGSVVLCQQGNRAAGSQSHSYPNTLYALDLADVTGEPAEVLAAAPGVVAQVVQGARPGDVVPGAGFGNYVKVEHEQGYFTMYAHLASADVSVGQRVASGAVLGKMGNTGKAGNVHLHFSLHQGDPTQQGAPESLPMHAIIAADVTEGARFGLFSSLEFVCAPSRVSTEGHLYGSENRFAKPPMLGLATPDILSELGDARQRSMVMLANTVGEVLRAQPTQGSPITRQRLEEIVAREPNNAEALYWIAVLSLRDLADIPKAKTALAKLVQLAPTDPAWVMPWVEVRLGQIAEAENKASEALVAYQRASSHRGVGAEFDATVQAALDRLSPKSTQATATTGGSPTP